MRELMRQYGLLWTTIQFTLGVMILTIGGCAVWDALHPPVLVVRVENRTTDVLEGGRMTIRGDEAYRLGQVAPKSAVLFSAKVPSEAPIGIRFQRQGKAGLQLSLRPYAPPGETLQVSVVADGDSLVRVGGNGD